MRAELAKQSGQSLRWASTDPAWESTISEVHAAEEQRPWILWPVKENAPSEGAFRVSLSGRRPLNLLLADGSKVGNFYLFVYTDQSSSPFAQLHRSESANGVECLTWRYIPTREDGRNQDRKVLFLRSTGRSDLEVPLPVRSTNASIRGFLEDLYYLVDAKLAADELDDSVELEPAAFPEGRILERRHRARERSSEVVALAKGRRWEQEGKLACDCCGFDFHAIYGEIGFQFIEAHHTIPVSEMEEGHVTRVEDIALVCANCHRMLHRARPWRSIKDLRKQIETGA